MPRPTEPRSFKSESSWRLVTGDNDSFDANSVVALTSQHDLDGFSAASSSSPAMSQELPSTQDFNNNNSVASQDSIRDFIRYRDDEDVILRQPFKPSFPITSRRQAILHGRRIVSRRPHGQMAEFREDSWHEGLDEDMLRDRARDRRQRETTSSSRRLVTMTWIVTVGLIAAIIGWVLQQDHVSQQQIASWIREVIRKTSDVWQAPGHGHHRRTRE